MKHYIDRLRDLPLEELARRIEQQTSEIEALQRDLVTMKQVLLEMKTKK